MATLEEFKPYIAPEVPGVDVITLENQLRLTINEFCEESWILQKGITHDVESGDIDTDLNDSILINLAGYASGLRPIAVSEILIDGEPFTLTHLDLVNDTPDLDLISADTQRVFCFSGTTSLIMAPFTGACRLFLRMVFKYLLSATTFDDRLLHDYVRGIAAGVKAELLAQPLKPWTNEARAEYFRQMFRREISNAKLKLGKDYSKASRAVYPRELGF